MRRGAKIIFRLTGGILAVSGIGGAALTYKLSWLAKNPRLAEPWEVSAYKAVPLRGLSRLWGRINEANLPVWTRETILGYYARKFDCRLEEAEIQDLKSFPNLSSFFRRRLKPDVRPICHNSLLVSPCDGKVLAYGIVDEERNYVEQVKGISYSLRNFLGPLTLQGPEITSVSTQPSCKTQNECQLWKFSVK